MFLFGNHHRGTMLRRRLFQLALLGAALSVLTGCPDTFRRPDNFSSEPEPLLAAIAARDAGIQSLTGQLALEVWRKSERVRLRQLVAVRSPDHLRIDSLSPFDQPLTTLVSNGKVMAIYDLGAHRFYEGAASPRNLARLIPVPLEPEALAALLRGGVPLLAEPETRTVDWDAENGWYQLDLARGDRTQRIHFEPKHLRVTALRFTRAGKVILNARLGDYSGDGPTAVPRRLRLEAPGEDVRVEVEVKDHQLNPELPDEAFTLSPPRGIAVESLDP
jgi:outer membrane lipoprotein-sorting protein